MDQGGLFQRLIVTFSFKYREYLRYIRSRQIGRAEKIIMNGGAKLNKKKPNNPKRFISQTSYPPDGEIAQATSYSLN